MNSVIVAINSAVGWIFNLLVGVLSWLGATWSLVCISSLLGVIFLFVFGRFSNQAAIRGVKQQIHAAVLEAIVFRNDLRMSLKAQAKMLGLSFLYIARALPPLLVLVPICIPVLAQLNRFYGAQGIDSKSRPVLEIQLDKGTPIDGVTITGDQQLNIFGPVRDSEKNQLFVGLTPTEVGEQHFTVLSSGKEVGRVTVNSQAGWIKKGIVSRISTNWLTTLLYPNDGSWFIDPNVIREITISYHEPYYKFLGFSLSWIIVFLIVSLAAGLVASKIFKIEV